MNRYTRPLTCDPSFPRRKQEEEQRKKEMQFQQNKLAFQQQKAGARPHAKANPLDDLLGGTYANARY